MNRLTLSRPLLRSAPATPSRLRGFTTSRAMMYNADIDPSLLTIEKAKTKKPKQASKDLKFGKTFTDHMLQIPWNAKDGWGAPSITPYGPLCLEPSAMVFHYSPTLFEGLKAYKDKEDVVRIFRPDKNMARMNNSAARVALPTFGGDKLIELIKRLVDMDRDWIPTDPGCSLYLRPTLMGTAPYLGVNASEEALLFVIMSPVGPYYSTGFKPVSLYASKTHVRAWPGGTGLYKLGANYAGGVVPQIEAAAKGYQQILWLFGEDHELTEVGTMNLFVVFDKGDGSVELVTPPIANMILPGVTRDSALALARAHAAGEISIAGLPKKLTVSERKVTMDEVQEASKAGTLVEMFGTGTAAVISAVEKIGYGDETIKIPCGESGLGVFAEAFNREITGRQTGAIESDWVVKV